MRLSTYCTLSNPAMSKLTRLTAFQDSSRVLLLWYQWLLHLWSFSCSLLQGPSQSRSHLLKFFHSPQPKKLDFPCNSGFGETKSQKEVPHHRKKRGRAWTLHTPSCSWQDCPLRCTLTNLPQSQGSTGRAPRALNKLGSPTWGPISAQLKDTGLQFCLATSSSSFRRDL